LLLWVILFFGYQFVAGLPICGPPAGGGGGGGV
jgi:hypothetical protein